jgi:hypothetical protein
VEGRTAHLVVKDAFALLRLGDTQHSGRFSDALSHDRDVPSAPAKAGVEVDLRVWHSANAMMSCPARNAGWEIATDAPLPTLPRIVSLAPSRHRKPTAPGSNANLLDSVRQKAVIWN